jgi:cobalamin biosynthesis protein CobW
MPAADAALPFGAVTGPSRVPTLVVSGFLGSGKTTLVRRLLAVARDEGARVAVVSNEFGDLGIDRALLGAGESAFVELEGGCVCCELSDDLVNTLQTLRERVRPDRIVIETSGVALPWDVQLNLWRAPVDAWIGDDAAVVVVNAEQLAEGRDLEGTFQDQISSADLLVLNKVDLVPDAALAAAEARLRGLEPEAPLVRSVHGDVDPALLFPPAADAADPARRRRPREPQPHRHESFASEELHVEAGVSAEELAERLRALGALRAKGFVRTAEGPRLVQVVGRRVEIEEPPTPPAPALLGRVVVIRRAGGDPAGGECAADDPERPGGILGT